MCIFLSPDILAYFFTKKEAILFMAPPGGFEPPTSILTGSRSTVELQGNVLNLEYQCTEGILARNKAEIHPLSPLLKSGLKDLVVILSNPEPSPVIKGRRY